MTLVECLCPLGKISAPVSSPTPPGSFQIAIVNLREFYLPRRQRDCRSSFLFLLTVKCQKFPLNGHPIGKGGGTSSTHPVSSTQNPFDSETPPASDGYSGSVRSRSTRVRVQTWGRRTQSLLHPGCVTDPSGKGYKRSGPRPVSSKESRSQREGQYIPRQTANPNKTPRLLLHPVTGKWIRTGSPSGSVAGKLPV